MVTVHENDCWVVAKLTSVAERDVVIKMVDLHINPDYTSFVQKISNCSEASLIDTVVKQGESFDCVFKLKIQQMPKDLEIGDLMSLMIPSGGIRGQVGEQRTSATV